MGCVHTSFIYLFPPLLYVILRFSYNLSNWSSPSPHFKTFHVFLVYFPKCPRAGMYRLQNMRNTQAIQSYNISYHGGAYAGRLQLKCDGTQWRTGGEVKGKLTNGLGSQYSTHYLGIWCVYPALLPLMRTPRLPIVDWTDAPADLNGFVRFAERQNLVSARVPSHFNWPLQSVSWVCTTGNGHFIQSFIHKMSVFKPATLLP
jgi:hypothetical protein